MRLVTFFVKEGTTLLSRLALNLPSLYPGLPSAGIAGMCTTMFSEEGMPLKIVLNSLTFLLGGRFLLFVMFSFLTVLFF